MKLPNFSRLVFLSVFSRGVPVKPMNIAPGSSSFIASCMLPDCVRCASSTKTKMLPLAAKSFGMAAISSRMNASSATDWSRLAVGAAELVDE